MNLRFIAETLSQKYGITVEYREGLGDYVLFRTRGLGVEDRTAKISRTQLAVVDPQNMVHLVEQSLQLDERLPNTRGQAVKREDGHVTETEIDGEPVTITIWADKWVKEHQ